MGVKELKEKQAAEAVEATQEQPSQVSATEARRQLAEMQAELDRIERKTGPSGAVPFTSKGRLLDASDVEAQRPNKRLRWVNVNSEKAEIRQASGYVRVPLAEGGRQVGNLALFEIPREEYNRRVEDVHRKNEERLAAHKTEVEQMAEAVAKNLRDRHGISVQAKDIMIVEQ